MNELQVFNFNKRSVRTMVLNDEPYFVVKDVAEILGYAKPRNAIATHVDDEDKKDAPIQGGLGGKQNMIVINESGVYSLVFGSKLPQAKEFKRWVTKEVLPTIRKTGRYSLPQTPEEKIDLLLQASSNANKRVEAVEERVASLEENRFLNPNEYGYLNTQVSSRIKEIKSVHQWNLNRKQSSELFRSLGYDIKQIAGVKCRSQIRYKDFDKVIDFIRTWEPSQATKLVINQMSMEV